MAANVRSFLEISRVLHIHFCNANYPIRDNELSVDDVVASWDDKYEVTGGLIQGSRLDTARETTVSLRAEWLHQHHQH